MNRPCEERGWFGQLAVGALQGKRVAWMREILFFF